jgi:hypothetical protein
MFSSLLRPYRPPEPPKPISAERLPVTNVPPALTANVPAARFEAEVVPAWEAWLDIQVWRSRPWWLKVAASLVVKRLGR